MTDGTGKPRAKRGNNEGSIRQRPDGRWEARFVLPNGTRTSAYGKTRAEARQKMDDAQAKARKGIDLKAERQTVAAYLAVWLEEVAGPKLRPSTLKTYRAYIDGHIIPALGTETLGGMTPQTVQRFLNGRSKAGLAPRTVGQIRAILRSALGQAVAWGYIERNVAALAKPPRIGKQEIASLTAEHARALIAATADDRLGNLFAVALATGLRQGELLGLRWPDVDLAAGTVRVRAAMQKVAGEWRFVEPKSDNGRRTVALSPLAVAAIAAQKEGARRCGGRRMGRGRNGVWCSHRPWARRWTAPTSPSICNGNWPPPGCPRCRSTRSGTPAPPCYWNRAFRPASSWTCWGIRRSP